MTDIVKDQLKMLKETVMIAKAQAVDIEPESISTAGGIRAAEESMGYIVAMLDKVVSTISNIQ